MFRLSERRYTWIAVRPRENAETSATWRRHIRLGRRVEAARHEGDPAAHASDDRLSDPEYSISCTGPRHLSPNAGVDMTRLVGDQGEK